jgi:hypothetical protein
LRQLILPFLNTDDADNTDFHSTILSWLQIRRINLGGQLPFSDITVARTLCQTLLFRMTDRNTAIICFTQPNPNESAGD